MNFEVLINLDKAPVVDINRFRRDGGFSTTPLEAGDVVVENTFTSGPTLYLRSGVEIVAIWKNGQTNRQCTLPFDDFVPTRVGEYLLPAWHDEPASRIISVSAEAHYGSDQAIRPQENLGYGLAVAMIRHQRPSWGNAVVPMTVVKIVASGGPAALADAVTLHKNILRQKWS